MARKRMIDPSIWTDEGMAELTPRQQLLYIGLFSNADDEGRMKGSPAAIRLILPTVYAEVDLEDVEVDLDAVLRSMRQLVAYTADGRRFLAFRKYHAWQKIDRAYPSTLPPPPEGSTNGYLPHDDHSMNIQRIVDEPLPTARPSRARAEVSTEEEKRREDSTEEDSTEQGSAEGCAADAALPDPVDWVWEFYRSEIQPEARICPRDKILARLKRFTPDELTIGMQNFRDDAWCMDHNRTRGASWFFHNDARSEHFLTMEPRAAIDKNAPRRLHG